MKDLLGYLIAIFVVSAPMVYWKVFTHYHRKDPYYAGDPLWIDLLHASAYPCMGIVVIAFLAGAYNVTLTSYAYHPNETVFGLTLLAVVIVVAGFRKIMSLPSMQRFKRVS